MKLKQFILLFFIIVNITLPSIGVVAEEITVYRQLKFQQEDTPNFTYAADPMFGRLVCPPMMQYNLLNTSFSSTIFDKISFDENSKNWSLTLNKSLTWQDGAAVQSSEAASIIENTLNNGWGESLGLEAVKVEASAVNEHTIKVQWKNGEFFGPYTFTGFPLFRKKDKSFECVGDFTISKVNNDSSIELKSKNKAKNWTFNQITLKNEIPTELNNSGTWFKIYQQDLIPKRSACKRTIDYPIFTVIDWNLKKKPIDNLEVRKILDKIIPRHHISSHIMAGQSDIVTGPFITVHPGYKRNLKFSAIKDREIGLRLKGLWPKERKLKLCFNDHQNLIENVLVNAFKAQGLETIVADPGEKDCDANVTALQTVWPAYNNVLKWSSNPNWPTFQAELSGFASNYLKTLSFAKPNFKSLQEIHSLLFNQRLSSVIMQHKACIEAGNGFKKQLPPLIMRNLSWFEDLLR